MPKTINLPAELVTDKTQWPKVIVLEEYEQRKENGELKVGIYKFKWQGEYYKIGYAYNKNKTIKSELYKIVE